MGICSDCGKKCTRDRERCRACYEASRLKIGSLTLDELRSTRPNWRGSISSHAKRMYRLSGRPLRCASIDCGYDGPALQVCHVRDVKHFSGSALINDVNAHANLIMLCANCHFEWDKGYRHLEAEIFEGIKLQSFKKRGRVVEPTRS